MNTENSIAGPSTYLAPRHERILGQAYRSEALSGENEAGAQLSNEEHSEREYVDDREEPLDTSCSRSPPKFSCVPTKYGDTDKRLSWTWAGPHSIPCRPTALLNSDRRRGRGRRKRLKPSNMSRTLTLGPMYIFLFFLAVALLLPICAGQDTSSSSVTDTSTPTGSTRATLSSTLTSTSTWTSSSASSSSTASSTRTYSLPSIPTSLSLPALNTSSPAIQLDLPSISSIYLTFSICTLTSNQTLLPNILVSTDDPPNFDLTSSSKLVNDASSGGLGSGKTGWNQRTGKNGGTWLINWKNGFGNFTIASSSSTSSDDGDDGGVQGDSDPVETGELVPISILFDLGTEDGDDGEGAVTGDMVIQMSASTNGPLNTISPSLPLLGDTTSSLALLFSPLLVSTSREEPTYPNYTLPSPQLVFEPFSALGSDNNALSPISGNSSLAHTNLSLAIIPTASSPTNQGLDYSICAIRQTVNSTGDLAGDSSGNIVLKTAVDEPQWSMLNEEEGYRHFWAVGGLTAEGNYTAWVMNDQGVLAGPIWFVMKQESFPCNLVLPTPLCPNIAYAAPLPANSTTDGDTNTSVDSPIQSLPDETAALLTSNLESFKTSLLSHACGRDLYSHVSGCGDCFEAYRDWLCRTVVPRCGGANGTSTATADSSSGSSSNSSDSSDTFPSPKIVHRTPSSNSSESELNPLSALPSISEEYDLLLPCLSSCNKVDRACPVDMGFRCPRRTVNAELDYAFWGDDNSVGHGGKDDLVSSYDRYGRRWCNG